MRRWPPMKIIFVNRFFYPDHAATSQMLTDLALFLWEAGYTVSVITCRQRYSAGANFQPIFPKVFRNQRKQLVTQIDQWPMVVS